MSRLRVLLLAPEANPDGITGSLIGYCLAEALWRVHYVTLMIRASREAPVRSMLGALSSVEVIRVAWLERFLAWTIHRVFKDNYYSQALQAFTYPFGIIFEWQAWRQIRARILAGEFDVVLRLLPVSAVRPRSLCFFFCAMGPSLS